MTWKHIDIKDLGEDHAKGDHADQGHAHPRRRRLDLVPRVEIGKPVLVKTSYFPNWKAHGAKGPYRAAPNLMVVVPTSHDVKLTYGLTGADWLGRFITLVVDRGARRAHHVEGHPALRRRRPARRR